MNGKYQESCMRVYISIHTSIRLPLTHPVACKCCVRERSEYQKTRFTSRATEAIYSSFTVRSVANVTSWNSRSSMKGGRISAIAHSRGGGVARTEIRIFSALGSPDILFHKGGPLVIRDKRILIRECIHLERVASALRKTQYTMPKG